MAVAGPSEPVMVRRKEKKFGIWVNTDSVLVDSAPSFYAVATSAPFTDGHHATPKICAIKASRSGARSGRSAQPCIFGRLRISPDAVVRIREDEGTSTQHPRRTRLRWISRRCSAPPSRCRPNLTEGDYLTRIFPDPERLWSFRSSRRLSTFGKSGSSWFLYNMSRQQPLLVRADVSCHCHRRRLGRVDGFSTVARKLTATRARYTASLLPSRS